MVDWIGVVGVWAVAVGVKTGLPVALLFLLGYALHRRQRALAVSPLARADAGMLPRAPRRRQISCWEVRGCPPQARDRCPAFLQPDMPCWRAVKQASGGHIEGRCFECSLLLSR